MRTNRIIATAALAVLGATTFVACKKESTVTPEASAKQTSVKRMGGSGGFNSLEMMGGKMRKVNSNYTDCVSKDGNCHPDDIVVTTPKIFSLDRAISQGAYGVSTLFSDNETAVSYIPDWNTAWFADVKKAVLSGKYTFVKAGTSMYLLGKVGEVNTNNFDYAISYKVQ